MINLEYKIWEIPNTEGSLYSQVEGLRGNPHDTEVIDPLRLTDIDKAVNTIWKAVEEGSRMVVFGDYDVDGVTACAILMNYLEGIGAEVYYKLPNRIEDGYGINEEAVLQLKEKGVELIITVDNGISAHGAAKAAADCGIDFIITDHHEPPEILPTAIAVVDPKRADDNSGYDTLSGAGVALCLVAAMEECTVNDILYDYSELAALGTVCDVMPLNKLNRTIVRAGLAVMNESPSEGVKAILTTAKQAEREVNAHTLGFTIGPRLNSAGRMEDPVAALSLLLSVEEEEAFYLAEQLEACNAERRKQELELIERLTIEAEKYLKMPILVLFGDDCHEGVIGLAAARLMRRYNKPTIVISLSAEEGKGSGRSLPGFSLYDALSACSEHLIGFGGHTLAAGMSIKRQNCEEFRQAINSYAVSIMTEPKPRTVTADGVITEKLTVQHVQKLIEFEPFGQQNPVPSFAITDVAIERVTAMKEQHCRVCFNHAGEKYWATFFGRTPASLGYAVGDRVDMILELSIYSTGTADNLSLLIKEIQPAGMQNDAVYATALFANYYYGKEATPEIKQKLYPSREFTAKVFRALDGTSALDCAMLLSKFPPADAGRVMAALFALYELELICERAGVLYRTENPKKRSLEESSVIGGLA